MKRHLFLSGPAFSGKSLLIREQLGRNLQNAGGFCTKEAFVRSSAKRWTGACSAAP